MPGADCAVLSPPVTWAQRSDLVYINIEVNDAQKPEIKVEKDSLYFKGKSGADEKTYEVKLDLFGEINPDESKFQIRGRNIEFVLIKAKLDEPFWTRLLKENKKYHWLKIDFGKWKAEDDSDDESGAAGAGGPGGAGGGDFEQMMAQMGGLGGMGGGMGGMPPGMMGMPGGMGGMMGMPGMEGMMGGMGGPGDFNDLDDGEGDSDDEDLPDLEETKPDGDKTATTDGK